MRGLRMKALIIALAAAIAASGGASAAELSRESVEAAAGTAVTLRISGAPAGAKAEWKSSNPSAAKVDANGRVKIVGEGAAEITARIGNETLACAVTARKTSLSAYSLTMEEGERDVLRVMGVPVSTKVSYATSNPDVVRVSESGRLIAVGVGRAAIRTQCLGKTMKCAVTVVSARTPDAPVSEADGEDSETEDPARAGSPAREEKVLRILLGFREKYPEGAVFTEETTYPADGRENGFCVLYAAGAGCAAFAFELSDAAFGIDAPAKVLAKPGTVLPPALDRRRVDADDLTENLRAGDVIRLYGDADGHTAIVLSADSENVTYAEANRGGKVRWGTRIRKSDLRRIIVNVITRY